MLRCIFFFHCNCNHSISDASVFQRPKTSVSKTCGFELYSLPVCPVQCLCMCVLAVCLPKCFLWKMIKMSNLLWLIRLKIVKHGWNLLVTRWVTANASNSFNFNILSDVCQLVRNLYEINNNDLVMRRLMSWQFTHKVWTFHYFGFYIHVKVNVDTHIHKHKQHPII